MKKLLIINFIIVSIWSCQSSNEETREDNTSIEVNSLEVVDSTILIKEMLNEFQFYTGNGKSFNSNFNTLIDPEIVPTEYVKSFFKYRDSIQLIKDNTLLIDSRFKKIDFINSVKSIKIKKLLDLCGGDLNGGLLLIFGINNKKLNFEVIGTKKIVDKKFIKDGGNWLGKDSLEYIKYGYNLEDNKIAQYLNFKNKPYIYFNKSTSKLLLELILTAYEKNGVNENSNLYFYYGYSKNNSNLYHPAVLFSTKSDLETNRTLSSANSDNFAFANRGGTCCPPQ